MARSRLSTLTTFDRETFLRDCLERISEARQLTFGEAFGLGGLPKAPAEKNIKVGMKNSGAPNMVAGEIEEFVASHLRAEPHRYVIGVDEVGRGCLAGPVVASAVILPLIEPRSGLARKMAKLDDSKLIAQPVREELSETIRGCAHFAIAEASPAEIDDINILNASLLAMRRAVYELLERLSLDCAEILVLVDGNRRIKEFAPRQKTVIQGDSKSAAIAAASVMAKVHRDKFMRELSESFPNYHWHSNKGYGSKVHRQALVDHGVTVWHRQSFRLFYDCDDLENAGNELAEEDLQLQFEAALE